MTTLGFARLALGVIVAAALGAAIFPSAGLASPQDKTQTATGTVTKVLASQRSVTVALTDGVLGQLTPGARVTVRYQPGDGGRNVALQITVARS